MPGHPRQIAEPTPVVRYTPRYTSTASCVRASSAYRPSRATSSWWRAALDDAAAVEHEDLVGLDDRRQPVGDHEAGAVAQDLLQRRLDRRSDSESRWAVASSRITTAGSFRITRAIATRCFSPPDRRYPRSPTTVSNPSGRRCDHVEDAGGAAGLDQLLVGGVGARVAQVVRDRVVEQVGVLGHDADRMRPAIASVTSRTSCPSIVTAPSRDVVDARDEHRQRGLARAGGADQRDHVPGGASTSMSCRIQSEASSAVLGPGPLQGLQGRARSAAG